MATARSSGFTLVELTVVILVVGILAVAALPRVFGKEFDERGFHDGVKAALSHARHVAVASRRFVCVSNANSADSATPQVSVAMDTREPDGSETNPVDCVVQPNGNGAAISLPGRAGSRACAANAVCPPEGVVLGGASVWFDPLGRSVSANKTVATAVRSISVSNQPDITVQPETGWVQ